MKKIAGKIAMILVLIILANSFISCFSVKAIKDDMPGLLFLTIPLDIITFPFQLIGLALGMDLLSMIFSETESKIYLANVGYSTLTEYYSLRETIYSLPEEELSFLKQTLNFIPEIERELTMEKIFSLHEEKIVSMIRAYNSLPEKEIVSSIERLKTLSEAELVSLLRTFNSLSEAELDSLIAEVKSLAENENVALLDNKNSLVKSEYVATAGYSWEKAYPVLRFQY